jgi:hypothetical protein
VVTGDIIIQIKPGRRGNLKSNSAVNVVKEGEKEDDSK